jgi:protein subunit release factor A
MQYKISKSDWERIGKTAGWFSESVNTVSSALSSIIKKIRELTSRPIDVDAEKNRILMEDSETKKRELVKLLEKRSEYQSLLSRLEESLSREDVKQSKELRSVIEHGIMQLEGQLFRIEELTTMIEANKAEMKANEGFSALERLNKIPSR